MANYADCFRVYGSTLQTLVADRVKDIKNAINNKGLSNVSATINGNNIATITINDKEFTVDFNSEANGYSNYSLFVEMFICTTQDEEFISYVTRHYYDSEVNSSTTSGNQSNAYTSNFRPYLGVHDFGVYSYNKDDNTIDKLELFGSALSSDSCFDIINYFNFIPNTALLKTVSSATESGSVSAFDFNHALYDGQNVIMQAFYGHFNKNTVRNLTDYGIYKLPKVYLSATRTQSEPMTHFVDDDTNSEYITMFKAFKGIFYFKLK